jgi:hypothetical protein
MIPFCKKLLCFQRQKSLAPNLRWQENQSHFLLKSPEVNTMKPLRILFLALVCLLLRPDAFAAPIYAGSVVDVTGDSAAGDPDITMAEINVDASSIQFLMYFAPGTLNPATTKSGFSLDTDQNAATGASWNGIGVDFAASQGYLGDTGTAHLWNYLSGEIGTSLVTLHPDYVEYSFSRSLFGSEDGLLDFIGTVQVALSSNSSSLIGDFAPQPFGPLPGYASTQAVPEPSTLLLFATAGLALLLWRRTGWRMANR